MNKEITVNMIESFRDTGFFCRESYPCQHDKFEVILKDGRKATAGINSVDVCSILNGLKDIGIIHPDWNHFSEYKNIDKLGMGWKIRDPNVILTELFYKNI